MSNFNLIKSIETELVINIENNVDKFTLIANYTTDEQTHCICGHKINEINVIEYDNKKRFFVGNKCINYFNKNVFLISQQQQIAKSTKKLYKIKDSGLPSTIEKKYDTIVANYRKELEKIYKQFQRQVKQCNTLKYHFGVYKGKPLNAIDNVKLGQYLTLKPSCADSIQPYLRFIRDCRKK
jgi:hypothetical protein